MIVEIRTDDFVRLVLTLLNTSADPPGLWRAVRRQVDGHVFDPPEPSEPDELARVRDASLGLRCLLAGGPCLARERALPPCGCANCEVFRLIWERRPD